jgi:hypothetical protein
METENKKVKKPLEGKKFEPGKSGNPKGRPPKIMSSVLTELKNEGFERITITQIIEAYEYVLGLSEDRIKVIAGIGSKTDAGKDYPIILRVIAKSLLDKRAPEIIETMLSRLYGKPKQQMEHSGPNSGPMAFKFDYSKLTTEELKLYIELQQKTSTPNDVEG